MGRSKHILPAQRAQIALLRNQGRSIREVAGLMNISRNAVFNAIRHTAIYGTPENIQRVPRQRKTTQREDRIILRLSEADRRKTAVAIHKEVSRKHAFRISVRTIRNRLREFELNGRVARKKPFVSKRNRKNRIQFAQEHLKWRP